MNYYHKGRKEMKLNDKGFSLIEVLVGLVILAIGILAIAGMQITSIRGNFFSDNVMQASIIGQDRLEYLRNLPLVATTFSIGTHNDGFVPIRGTTFTRTYAVEQHLTLTDSRVIRVIVNWRDTSDHTVSFSTVKSP